MSVESYKNVIIGTGEAGKFLAWTLGKQGQRTVAVERWLVGGACPNVACLPSKNVIQSARVTSLVGRAGEFGVEVSGTVRVDMAGVLRRKREMVEGLARLHAENFAGSGAEVAMGEARFVEARTLRVMLNGGGERVIRGERVFLNLGSRAALPAIPGLAEAGAMTHVEALELGRLPEHLVVLGGGYVGVEFAQAMRRFGSRVTIVQRGGQLLADADEDAAEAVLQLMRDEGIEVLLNAMVASVSGKSGEHVVLEIQVAGETRRVEATDILVSAGRTPNTDRIGVEAGGVELTASGHVRVDDRLRTTAEGVWAMGDCAGSPHFTHASLDDFRVVRDNLAGKDRTTTGRVIPSVLFTDPELAHIGLSEREAKAKGVKYRVARIPMVAVLRTRTLGETRGFAKVLVGEDGQVAGFTAFGSEASEMLAVVQTAMAAKMSYAALADMIFTHPTVAEGVGMLMGKVGSRGPE